MGGVTVTLQKRLLLAVVLFCAGVWTLQFEDPATNYALFQKWDASTTGSLSFEFKTTAAAVPNMLLMYLDDGGLLDFIELRLVNYRLQLRFRIGNTPSPTLTLGQGLADGRWHSVKIDRSYQNTTLTLDGQSRLGAALDKKENTLTSHSFLHFGGIPASTELLMLALPSALFEPRFRGHVRNVRYRVSPAGQWNQLGLVESQGVSAEQDVCAQSQPCQHGTCLTTDDEEGFQCVCTGTSFEGKTCSEGKTSNVATFDGQTFFGYNLGARKTSTPANEHIRTNADVLEVQFRTASPNGLLLHTGAHTDYIFVGLINGELQVAINLGAGPYVATISAGTTDIFSDNVWHHLQITRKRQEITIIVDKKTYAQGSTPGDFALLTSDSMFYVGGAPDPSALAGSLVDTNFVGCMMEVVYSSDSLTLHLSDAAKAGDKFVVVEGSLAFECLDTKQSDPVTFTNSQSYLSLPKWQSKLSGSFSFRFRTNEPNGVLVYSTSASQTTDFFALELQEGYLFLGIDLGSGAIRFKGHQDMMNDGVWHEIVLKRNKKIGTLLVDQNPQNFEVGGDSAMLNLESGLYVGGFAAEHSTAPLPAQMWTASSRQGFVGCMRDMVVDGRAVDLVEQARQSPGSGVGDYCQTLALQCPSQPCLNGGLCSEGWNRYVCDCSQTGYVGQTCSQDAATLTFDGSQHLSVTLKKEKSENVKNDISLRFMTKRNYGTLLALLPGESSGSMLLLVLDAGQLKCFVKIAGQVLTLAVGSDLNNYRWHTLYLQKRGNRIKLTVDGQELDDTLGRTADDQYILAYKMVDVGSLSTDSLSREQLNIPSNFMTPNFMGHMEQLQIDGRSYFELVKSDSFGDATFELTAQLGPADDSVVANPVTFLSPDAHVILHPPNTYPSLTIFFQFRTTETDGVVLFSQGAGQDFMAVELVGGYLHYVFNMGDGAVTMRANTVQALSNNEWHDVTITRDKQDKHVLQVNDATSTREPSGSKHIDLTENIQVGGVSSYSELPKAVTSRHGYVGCLASLDMNGWTPKLLEEAINKPGGFVAEGCEGPTVSCTPKSCVNRGQCVELWNSFTCDCSMTSYSGSTCDQVSASFTFGVEGGMVTFVYPEDQRTSSVEDKLAFGVQTTASDAVVARVDSGSSNDFIKIEIDGGYLFVEYNVGKETFKLAEMQKKVNDDLYHVVRFSRNGPNAELQVDDQPALIKKPKDATMKVFNDHMSVMLGGVPGNADSSRQRRAVEQPFTGLLSGLSFNDLRPLDLVAAKDPRISVEGAVALVENPDIPMQPEDPVVVTLSPKPLPTKATPSMTTPTQPIDIDETQPDDIITASGDGCDSDDEDDCPMSGSGDGSAEIIVESTTPVTTPSPTTGKPTVTIVLRTCMLRNPCENGGLCLDRDHGDYLCQCLPGFTGLVCESAVKPTPVAVAPTSSPTEKDTTPKVKVMTPSSRTAEPTPKERTTPKPATDKPLPGSSVTPMGAKNTTKPTERKPQGTMAPPTTKDDGGGGGGDGGTVGKSTNKDWVQTGMIIGIAAAVCLLILALAFIIYKYRSKSEGSYRINESRNYQYGDAASATAPARPPANGTNGYAAVAGSNGTAANPKQAKKTPPGNGSKEWYV